MSVLWDFGDGPDPVEVEEHTSVSRSRCDLLRQCIDMTRDGRYEWGERTLHAMRSTANTLPSPRDHMNPFKASIVSSFCLLLALSIAGAVQAQETVDVLWYGDDATYNSNLVSLAADAASWDPEGDGFLNWNLTIWDGDDATAPDFGLFDAFVVGSYAGYVEYGGDADYAPLLSAESEISDARGSRTFLSGQDADYHTFYDSDPQAPGFLYNAVNWAASGTGLGIVALADGWAGTGSRWWDQSTSFLYEDMLGVGGTGTDMADYYQEESVVIPGSSTGYPVNEGLTSSGLSNWGVSAHVVFDKDVAAARGYTSINDAGSRDGWAVTILTESEASGGTTGPTPVPEPSSLMLLSSGLLALAGFAGRRREENDRPV